MVMIALVLLLACTGSRALAQSLLPNGSFEDGQTLPVYWQLKPTARWVTGRAHGGRRYLSGRSSRGENVAVSASIELVLGNDYRIEGWLRSAQGEARLGVDLLAQDGRLLGQVSSAPVYRCADWRYVAVEWGAGKAQRARVWFRVKGVADVDDILLSPVELHFIGNGGVERDDRGRLPFWNEETDDSLVAGRREGRFEADSEVKHAGNSSLRITATGAWCAVSSVHYPVRAWTDRYEISAWVRCEEGATGQILACWIDNMQKPIRVDAGTPVQSKEWQRISMRTSPPLRAMGVRIVAVARGGTVWFDDFDFVMLRASKPVITVFANQVGYDVNAPKGVIIATNFFPRASSTVALHIVSAEGKVVWSRDVACSGRIYSGKPDDWGWYFWRADFTPLRQEGSYRAVARVGQLQGQSYPFKIARGLLLKETAQYAVDFFFIQRCGYEVPGWHKACHLDDAKLPDGTHIDAVGGWHSAGDYNKPMWQFGDSGVTFALAYVAEALPQPFISFDRDRDGMPDIVDEAWWGAKFLAKMQNPEDGSMRADVNQGPGRDWMKWTAPDVHTDNIIGTPDDPVIVPGVGRTPLAVAAWSVVARLLRSQQVPNDYVQRALRLWRFLEAQPGAADDPLMLINAIELYRTTDNDEFRQFAQRVVERLLNAQSPDGGLPGETGGAGDVAAAAMARYLKEFPRDVLRPRIIAALRRWVDYITARTDNPFGLTRQGSEKQNPRIFNPSVGMGVNFWILSRAWASALVYQVTRDKRALAFAVDQVDWIFGKNPLHLCMFEGKGSFNPPRYHHRYNQIPGKERGAVPGAIPNGIMDDMGFADRPGFDMSRGGSRAPSFRPNEPWLCHNMFYLLAACELHRALQE